MSQLARSITGAALLAIAATNPRLALDASDPYVFVPNRASADVAVIDSRTDRLVARIPVGNVPHQVAISEVAGKLVASNTADDTISIVDLATSMPRRSRSATSPSTWRSPRRRPACGRQHRGRHRVAGVARR